MHKSDSGFLDPGERLDRIMDYMEKRRIRSFNELAREAGIDRSTLTRALKSGSMNLSTLLALAKTLGCKAGVLLDR